MMSGNPPFQILGPSMSSGNFVRRPSAANSDIIVSRCIRCGALVAAAPSQNTLQIAEKNHRCK